MSQYQLTQSIYASDLKSRAVLVMNYLVNRSNKENTCFPSIKTIARDVHVSINTVKRALRDLLTAGFIKKEARFVETKNGAQTSNLYTLFEGKNVMNETDKMKNENVELKVESKNEILQKEEIIEMKSEKYTVEVADDNTRHDIEAVNFIENKIDEIKVKKEKNVVATLMMLINTKYMYKFFLENPAHNGILKSIKRASQMILSKLPTNGGLGGLPPRPM